MHWLPFSVSHLRILDTHTHTPVGFISIRKSQQTLDEKRRLGQEREKTTMKRERERVGERDGEREGGWERGRDWVREGERNSERGMEAGRGMEGKRGRERN